MRLALVFAVAPCRLQTGEGTAVLAESVTGGYSTQAQAFTESISSLGHRGLKLYSVDCEGIQNYCNFQK